MAAGDLLRDWRVALLERNGLDTTTTASGQKLALSAFWVTQRTQAAMLLATRRRRCNRDSNLHRFGNRDALSQDIRLPGVFLMRHLGLRHKETANGPS